MATDFQRIIDRLAAEGVEYVLVGGLALVAHDFSRETDLDPASTPTRAGAARRPWPPAFIEAITEDQGDKVEALHLRAGDRFVLTAPEKKAETAAKPATAPAAGAPPRAAKPS